MTLVSVIVYAFLQMAIPILIGSLFGKVYKGEGRLIFCWISGQMLLWAGFQLITVPFVLYNHKFKYVLWCMIAMVLALSVLAIVLLVRNGEWKQIFLGKERSSLREAETEKEQFRIRILQILSVVLLAFQLIMTLCYAYEEGDDAFYLALSTDTVDSGVMYSKNPYTGYTTGLDIRHGLAPFPMWISLLSKISGILPITMAQLVVPVVVILMAYGIHYLVGKQLFRGKREAFLFYMVLVEMLVIFGGYSTYAVENFLLVRASQGKAVLCNLVLPFLVLLCLWLVRTIQKGREVPGSYWVLLWSVGLAGCLCSTQGGLLICIMLAIVGFCIAVVHKRWKYVFLLGSSCLFPMGFMLLYMVRG